MSRSAVPSFRKRFITRILLPVLGAVLLVAVVACVASAYLTVRGDTIAIGRQEREARAAIVRNILKIGTEQETIAIWDDPVLLLRKRVPDQQWLQQNMGGWLNALFGHDSVYILDGRDRPVYVMENGKRSGFAAYAQAEPDLRFFIDAVRGRSHQDTNLFERLPGRPLPKGSRVLTGANAIHATDLALVSGRPAIVSVMRILPLSDKVKPVPGGEPLLVSIRFLDGDWMHDLSRQNLIDGARFSRTSKVADNEVSLPLRSDRGTLGYLAWRPERPASMLQKDMVWVGGGLTAALVLILSLLIRGLHNSTARVFLSEQELRRTVTELRASEAQAQHLAFHDVLTGLPNRAFFRDRIQQALGTATEGNGVALMLLDIDRFKHINDTLGHQAGDALIMEFGTRVIQQLDGASMLARLGGDEFAVVVPHVVDPDAIHALCERIVAAIRRPFEISGTHSYVTTSIGLAMAPEFGVDRTELMRKADIALYRAKAEGRDCYRAFAAEMDETVKTRSVVEADLRAALEAGGQLELFYQPEVAAHGGPVVGMEALIRWRHPTRGLVSPETFIPVAEESGLIVPLGEWILREACRTSLRWPGLFIAVNLSPIQFRTPNFAARVIEIVDEEGADPLSLELEITESVLVQDNEEVAAALRRLRSAGFRIALDDFGTGYSSLNYLSRFEVDKIKIDRSFVQNLGTVDAAAIVTAVVTLGHAMGLEVTAEGVETDDQSAFLAAAGCNVLQGYFYSPAVPEHEVRQILRGARLSAAA